jgi:hypothetical protein
MLDVQREHPNWILQSQVAKLTWPNPIAWQDPNDLLALTAPVVEQTHP